MDKVKPIVDDIKNLIGKYCIMEKWLSFILKERGIDIVNHGVQKKVRVALAGVSAGNLGSLAWI